MLFLWSLYSLFWFFIWNGPSGVPLTDWAHLPMLIVNKVAHAPKEPPRKKATMTQHRIFWSVLNRRASQNKRA